MAAPLILLFQNLNGPAGGPGGVLAQPDNKQTFVGPAVVPIVGGPPNRCLLGYAQEALVRVCEPSRLIIKMRSAAFDITPFKTLAPQYGTTDQNTSDPEGNPGPSPFSGARTGVTFEGPFLRYQIAPGARRVYHGDQLDIDGKTNNASPVYFFDLVGQRSLYLPYEGSIDVVGQYPGAWSFEWMLMRAALRDPGDSAHAIRRPTPLDSDATLTMRVAPAGVGDGGLFASRAFASIPAGAHSFTYTDDRWTVGSPNPTATINQEDVPAKKGAFSGPSGPLDTSPVLQIQQSQASFMGRIGHHNASGLVVTSGSTNASGFVQWHLSFV